MNNTLNCITVSAVEAEIFNNSVMREAVSAQTAVSSVRRRSTACKKSAELMNSVLKCLLSSHSSFFSHLMTD